jgi:hypothetical protein
MTLFARALASSERLTTEQLMQAFKLWDKGKDTWDIAQALEESEPVVFNSLREARERLRVVRLEAVSA